MNNKLWQMVGASLLLAPVAFAEVTIKTEQLNPADPAWKFKTILGAVEV